jgi:hypothetical protein
VGSYNSDTRDVFFCLMTEDCIFSSFRFWDGEKDGEKAITIQPLIGRPSEEAGPIPILPCMLTLLKRVALYA